MEKVFKKCLSFNGKKIYFLFKNGTYYIALKPICEALNVDWENQRKSVKANKFYGQLPLEQTVVAADGRLREMICLPEKFIYGWIFKLDSSADGFSDFQMKCYELLYDYFHGSIIDRIIELKVKSEEELKLENLERQLKEMALFKEIQTVKSNIIEAKKNLTKMDKKLIDSQIEINFK